jgi:stage V sporulation protein G
MVCMPSRKMNDGSHKDVAHPINNDFRRKIEIRVMAEYENQIKKQEEIKEKVQV